MVKKYYSKIVTCFILSLFLINDADAAYKERPNVSTATGILNVENGGSGTSLPKKDMTIIVGYGKTTTASNGTDTVRTYQLPIYAQNATFDFKICYANRRFNSSFVLVGGNTITVKSAIEIGSTYIPVTFNGQSSVDIQNGMEICSDTIPADVSSNTTYYIRSSVSVTSGGVWPTGYLGSNLSTYSNNGTDAAFATGALANTGCGAVAFSPSRVMAKTSPNNLASIYISGDSIADGSTGEITPPNCDNLDSKGGFIVRGIGNYSAQPSFPFYYSAVPSSMVLNRVKEDINVILNNPLSSSQYFISNYGTNDIYNGSSLASVKANLQAHWTKAARRGLKVYQTTILPRTVSSDYFVTASNQSIANASYEAVRVGINDWIRTKPAPLTDYIEIADVVECNASNVLTRNGGRWCVFGTSPLVSGVATGGSTSTLIDTTKSWTTNQYAGYTLVITSGTGAGSCAPITKNTSNTITLYSITAPDATSNYIIQETPTCDGTHPFGKYNARLAVPVANTVSTFIRQ